VYEDKFGPRRKEYMLEKWGKHVYKGKIVCPKVPAVVNKIHNLKTRSPKIPKFV
jgi:hypothetical protein